MKKLLFILLLFLYSCNNVIHHYTLHLVEITYTNGQTETMWINIADGWNMLDHYGCIRLTGENVSNRCGVRSYKIIK